MYASYEGVVYIGSGWAVSVSASNTQDARYEVARAYKRSVRPRMRIVDILPHVSVRRERRF